MYDRKVKAFSYSPRGVGDKPKCFKSKWQGLSLWQSCLLSLARGKNQLQG